MNPDLKLRLKPFSKLSEVEFRFWRYLCDNLGMEVLLNTPEGTLLNINLCEIENDEDDSAYIEKDGLIYDVYIDNRMPLGMCIDFCLHELAHARSWYFEEEDDHGPAWGISYSILYRLYLDLYERFWCE